MVKDTLILSEAEMYAKECSFYRYIIYCNIREGYGERGCRM